MVSLPEGLHGAYSRAEILQLLGRFALRTALEDGRLTAFSREVVVDTRRATDFATRAAASLLFAGPKAALNGHTALALHGCSAADSAPIHVLLPYHRKLRRRPGVVVHHGSFDEQDVTEVNGLRTLVPDLAVTEVLCSGTKWAGLACADQVLALLPEAERAECRAWIEERIMSRPDSRGRRQARTLLELATGLPESPPESWMLVNLVERGLPPPEPQFRIRTLAGDEIYRLDFAWPEVRIALEYDGYAAHEGREERDAARDADLRRRGWIVIRADADDLKNPGRVVGEIREAFRVRGLAA